MKYLKYVLRAALLCAVAVLLMPTVANNVELEEWSPPWQSATELDDSSALVGAHHVAARDNARKAAVKVLTPDGRGSGTYFKIGKYFVVITAQHVVRDSEVVLIEGRNGETVLGQPILQGAGTDVAVILVPEINSRDALSYRPMPSPRNVENLIGKEVTYTGFPASHDLMTIDGKIAGYENGHIIVHSYGWPGSSGSGVFDMRGRIIGVVSAVDVGQWNWMIPPQLVEDIVWVAPLWTITEREIQAHLRSRGE